MSKMSANSSLRQAQYKQSDGRTSIPLVPFARFLHMSEQWYKCTTTSWNLPPTRKLQSSNQANEQIGWLWERSSPDLWIGDSKQLANLLHDFNPRWIGAGPFRDSAKRSCVSGLMELTDSPIRRFHCKFLATHRGTCQLQLPHAIIPLVSHPNLRRK